MNECAVGWSCTSLLLRRITGYLRPGRPRLVEKLRYLRRPRSHLQSKTKYTRIIKLSCVGSMGVEPKQGCAIKREEPRHQRFRMTPFESVGTWLPITIVNQLIQCLPIVRKGQPKIMESIKKVISKIIMWQK